MKLFFDRPAMKQRAKANLKRNFWIPLVVCLLVTIAMGGVSLPTTTNFSFNFSPNDAQHSEGFQFSPFTQEGGPALNQTVAGVVAVVLLLLAIFLLVSIITGWIRMIFAANPLWVGKSRFFINMTRGTEKFKDLAFGFSNSYRNAVTVMFLRSLYLVLWMLLAIAPLALVVIGLFCTFEKNAILAVIGIVLILAGFIGMIALMILYTAKFYEYFAIPYLLAEHPQMKAKEAFAASKKLTKGYKAELFVLDLSFIGWQILGSLALGVGIYFVLPYMEATYAEAYADLCQIHGAKAKMAENPWVQPMDQQQSNIGE